MKCGPNCRRGHCLDVFTHTVSDRRVSKYTPYPPGGSESTHRIRQEGQQVHTLSDSRVRSLSKVELLEMVLHIRFSSCSEIVLVGSYYLLKLSVGQEIVLVGSCYLL